MRRCVKSPNRVLHTDPIRVSGWRGTPLISEWSIMRRLFFTFARGLPGVGLLILRLGTGIALVIDGVRTLQSDQPIEAAIIRGLAAIAGLLLLAGLWTPVVGVLVAILELCAAWSRYGDPWIHVLLGVLGVALALIGPGAWSVDARLFGWKRIDIPDRKS